MKERNSWVTAECDGEGCEATVCSRCVFASKHRDDADGEAHVASHCIACERTFCSDCAALLSAEADDDGVGGMLTCGDCGGDVCVDCRGLFLYGVCCRSWQPEDGCLGYLCEACFPHKAVFCMCCGECACEECAFGTTWTCKRCGDACFCDKCTFEHGIRPRPPRAFAPHRLLPPPVAALRLRIRRPLLRLRRPPEPRPLRARPVVCRLVWRRLGRPAPFFAVARAGPRPRKRRRLRCGAERAERRRRAFGGVRPVLLGE